MKIAPTVIAQNGLHHFAPTFTISPSELQKWIFKHLLGHCNCAIDICKDLSDTSEDQAAKVDILRHELQLTADSFSDRADRAEGATVARQKGSCSIYGRKRTLLAYSHPHFAPPPHKGTCIASPESSQCSSSSKPTIKYKECVYHCGEFRNSESMIMLYICSGIQLLEIHQKSKHGIGASHHCTCGKFFAVKTCQKTPINV